MTGSGGRHDDMIDARLVEAIRDSYRDVHLPVSLAEVRQRSRRRWTRIVAPARFRTMAAVAASVTFVIIGTWALFGPGNGSGDRTPGHPLPSAATGGAGKPTRPTSSATTDAGRCADYTRAEMDPSRTGPPPPPRLGFNVDQTRLLIYAADDLAVTCWLSGDLFTVGGSATAVNDEAYPAGQLSYHSEDSGHGWGGVAFGRVPAGTTQVTISFPSGSDAQATIVGEWYGWFAPPGPKSDELTTATQVTAVTPTGNVTRQIQHG